MPRAATSAPRVLVVDDQPSFRDAARYLLERRGYIVVAQAGCAASALDAVVQFAPPGGSGALRLHRRGAAYRALVVVRAHQREAG